MKDTVKTIIEGIVSQGKLVGSRGHAFRASSSSDASRTDKPGKHEHGVDIGASRNYAHEKAAKEKAELRTREREQEIEKRTREAEQRKKEVAKMASEEHIEEAKGKWVQDKPLKAHVAAMEKKDTEDLKGMHSRWSGDHRDKKSDPSTSERLLAVHHVLKKRGENVPDLPQHKNLGMIRHFTAEEAESAGTKARVKIKNVARPGDPEPTSEKSTLAKTGSIKTKIVEEKPLMSDKNFGLPASLIAAARQIVEKKHEDDNGEAKKMQGGKTDVIVNPETDDKINEKEHTVPKTAKHKKLAALAHPKDKITHKDVLVGRGVINKEELSAKEKMKRGLYRKEETEIEEGDAPYTPITGNAPKGSSERKRKAVQMALGRKNKDHPDWNPRINPQTAALRLGRKLQKEDAELEEGSIELKPAEFHSVRTGKKSVEDLAKEKNADVGRVRGEYKTHADHWSKGEAHYNKLFKEGVQQIDELSPKTLGSYAVKVAKLAPEKVKPSREAGIEKATKKLRGMKEELSPQEIERIEELAKSFPTEIDEAVKKSVPMATTAVSAPLRGANQDYSGVGTKSSVADYTISDGAKFSNMHGDLTTKKVKSKMAKEEVELEEGRGRPRKNPLPPGKEAEGDDTHKHPMQQLEKISHSMEGNEPHFEHKDGSKSKITKHLAKHIVAIHNSMRTTQEKDNFAQKVHANRDSLRSEVSKHF